MVKWCILFLLLTTHVLAGQGRIVVLEAPMFRRPIAKSKIVQYVQKGETVYIHPQVLVDEKKYRQLRPTEARRLRYEKELSENPDFKDAFFDGSETQYHEKMNYVLTKDNQGRDAWLLRKHVHIWYEDEREFAQLPPNPDPTDYRLYEPLPDGYPLYDYGRVRGWAQFSIGSAFSRNYPYREKILAEGYGQQLELNGAMVWQRPSDETQRMYVGGMFTVRSSSSDYTLQTRRSTETWTRVGFGPLITYDVYRREKNQLTLTMAPIIYPYAQASITQTERAGREDTRTYWGWSGSGRFGVQYTRLRLFPALDLVIGVWSEAEAPLSMRSKNTAAVSSWWVNNKGDNFSTGFTYTFAGQIGIQSSY